MKRKEPPPLARGSAHDKRRRLDPMLWRRDEVWDFLVHSADLSKEAAGKAEAALALSGPELRAAVHSGSWDLAAVPAAKRGAVDEAAKQLLDPLFPKFLLYDSNGNGTIDCDEFRHLVRATTGMNPSPEEFSQLMRAADVNGDGGITFGEFRHFCETNDAALAKSLREVVLEKMLAAEEAALRGCSPFFETTPSAAMLGASVHVGRTKSAVRRLTLTRRARARSTLCSVVLLALAAVLAFWPLLKLSDVAVPDTMNIEMLVQDVQRMHGKGGDAKCKSFITSHCSSDEWRPGRGWTKSEYRSCAKRLHPDKPGGSAVAFRQLKDCNDKFEDLATSLRQKQHLVVLALYVMFTTDLVVVATCSSTSAALLYVARALGDPTAVASSLAAAVLPDLLTSFRLFVVLCGCSLALGTYALAKFRGQAWPGGWLAGARVCRVDDGLPAGTLRVLALDAVQGLTDVALMLLVRTSLMHLVSFGVVSEFAVLVLFAAVTIQIGLSVMIGLGSINQAYESMTLGLIFSNVTFQIWPQAVDVLMRSAIIWCCSLAARIASWVATIPAFVLAGTVLAAFVDVSSLAILTMGACVVQHLIASKFEVLFGGRSLAEFATGTVLLCVRVDRED